MAIRRPWAATIVSLPHNVGELLCAGLRESAEKHGLQIGVSGPPALPLITFANESNLHRSQRFVLETLKRGVFFRHHYNWFLCAAHRSDDIDQALDVVDQAFAIVKNTFGD